MPSVRVRTDRGNYIVKSDQPLTADQYRSALMGDLPGVTVTPETPSLGTLAEGAATGGDPTASATRTLGRAGMGLAGGLVGGLAGAPFGVAPLTAPLGAMAFGGLGEMARQSLSNEPRSAASVLKQAGSAGLGEIAGQALGPSAKATQMAQRSTLAPDALRALRTAEKFGVPTRASEITGSRLAAGLERFPERFSFGAGPSLKFTERQVGALESAVKGQVPTATRDAMQAGIAAQREIPEAIKTWKGETGALFRRIEAMTGDAPVVDLGPVVGRAKGLSVESQAIPPSRPVQTVAGRKPAGAEGVEEKFGVDIEALPPHMRDLLQGAAANDYRVSFAQARRLESELGEASKFHKPFGSLTEGQTRALYNSTRDAISRFLESDEGAQVAPQLAAAKQAWRVGRQTFEKGINNTILKRNPERVVDAVFRPGATSDMLEFRQAVSPATWDAAKIAWMAGLIDKASASGTFNPGKFAKEIEPFIKSGQVTEAFGEQTAKNLGQIADLSKRLKSASALAANPSGTGQAVLSSSQLFKLGEIAASPIALMLGGRTAGLTTAAAEVALPPAMARWTLSRPGIETLMYGLAGKYRPASLKIATQLAIQGEEEWRTGGR